MMPLSPFQESSVRVSTLLALSSPQDYHGPATVLHCYRSRFMKVVSLPLSPLQDSHCDHHCKNVTAISASALLLLSLLQDCSLCHRFSNATAVTVTAITASRLSQLSALQQCYRCHCSKNVTAVLVSTLLPRYVCHRLPLSPLQECSCCNCFSNATTSNTVLPLAWFSHSYRYHRFKNASPVSLLQNRYGYRFSNARAVTVTAIIGSRLLRLSLLQECHHCYHSKSKYYTSVDPKQFVCRSI